MAQSGSAKKRYLHGNEQFPILHEDDRLRVYKNSSNEIFVEDVRSGVSARIISTGLKGFSFVTGGLVEPIQINDMIGWYVRPR
jgi:hypothetical protein